MNVSKLNSTIQNMDIYLLDQVLKGRFTPGSKVLDAGFGSGRNIFWFLDNGFEVHGIDQKKDAVVRIHDRISKLGKNPDHFIVGLVEDLPYTNNEFDIIICNAVLHFANDQEHFYQMFDELIRVLKPGGTLFIRMASNIGIEDKLKDGKNGVHLLPDGTHRFLLTREIMSGLLNNHHLELLESLKTVNVDDLRCMSTLVMTKR